jgi:hypothetical protein
LFAILFFNSCKKDIQPVSESNSKVSPVELTQNLDQIQHPEIKELAELLEVKMRGSKLVRHFKKSGQPLWDHVVLSVNLKGGTEIIVPFAKDGYNLLTAILICQKYNGKYYYHFVTAKELDGSKAKRLNKEGSKYLLTLLKMNNLVYGTTDFSYPLSSIHGASRKGRPMLKIHADHTLKVDSKQEDGWVNKYTCITWNKNCTWQDSNCNPVCDMCSYCAVTECTMDLVYVEEEHTLNDDPMGNPTGGNSSSYPTVYEYYERNYGQVVNQIIIDLNLNDAEILWLAQRPEIADAIKVYCDNNGNSAENQDFVKWVVGYLKENSGFDYNIFFSDNEFSGIDNMPANITEEPLINNGIDVNDLPDNTPQNQNRIIGSAPKRHGNNPEDLQFGTNGNVSGIYSPLINKSDAELFSSMRNLLWKTSVLSPEMRSVTTQMADRFENNIGGTFENATLSQKVKLSVQYQNFLKTFGKELSKELTKTSGKINQIPNIETNSFRPIFNGFWNKFAGLQIAINDTEAHEIKLLNFRTEYSTFWYADVEVTIYDNYGLDKADALKYQGKHLGFAAWWLLQHTRSYKPFVTKVVIKSRINGSY